MWQMIGVLAELERSLISEPTRAGVKAAIGRGVKFGRTPKSTPQQIDHARKMIETEGFAMLGGIIILTIEGNKLHFEVNPTAADRAGLKISSKLLGLAKIVKEQNPEGQN